VESVKQKTGVDNADRRARVELGTVYRVTQLHPTIGADFQK